MEPLIEEAFTDFQEVEHIEELMDVISVLIPGMSFTLQVWPYNKLPWPIAYRNMDKKKMINLLEWTVYDAKGK